MAGLISWAVDWLLLFRRLYLTLIRYFICGRPICIAWYLVRKMTMLVSCSDAKLHKKGDVGREQQLRLKQTAKSWYFTKDVAMLFIPLQLQLIPYLFSFVAFMLQLSFVLWLSCFCFEFCDSFLLLSVSVKGLFVLWIGFMFFVNVLGYVKYLKQGTSTMYPYWVVPQNILT